MLVLKEKGKIYADGEVLQKDAVANEGTLLLLDFSNPQSLDNYSTKLGDPVKNMAINDLEVGGNLNRYMSLNDRRGLKFTDLTGVGQGVNLGPDLIDYLVENEDHNYAFIFWIESPSGSADLGTRFFRPIGGDTTTLSISFSRTRAYSVSFCGVTYSVTLANSDTPYQLGLIKNGSEIRRFVNGNVQALVSSSPPGFAAADGVGIGNWEDSNAAKCPAFLYRLLIEDLTVSGRSYTEAIRTDYNYVNALGEYAGIAKRPYANV